MTKLNSKKTEKLCIYEGKKFCRIDSLGQFHQHSMSSFYTHKSQKRKKLSSFIVLLGSARKSCALNVGEIDPWMLKTSQLTHRKSCPRPLHGSLKISDLTFEQDCITFVDSHVAWRLDKVLTLHLVRVRAQKTWNRKKKLFSNL